MEQLNRRVFSFAGLTLSDLRKSLLEGTLESIMWVKWGSPSIPLGRGDLHITHPKVYYQAFFWVLIDLIVELLGLIIKPFDNQTES